MKSIRIYGSVLFLLLASPIEVAFSQFGGSRAGVQDADTQSPPVSNQLPTLKPEVAESYITIEGTAEIRVRPTQVRVVLAVTSQAETAQMCRQEIAGKVKQLRADWKKLGLTDDKVVEDFIAVLPRYEWLKDKREDRDVLVEQKTGYRMQSNLHLAVADDRAAQAAIDKAFDAGVTDIIAFDYGSEELDKAKEQARAAALKVARSKSELLLSGVTQGEPTVINLQEQTSVHYPESLYRSFTNVDDQVVTSGWRDGIPQIHANRPKNTYYRGLTFDGDIQPRQLPMQSEISVVSIVRLYFASPALSKKSQRPSESAAEPK